MLLDETLILVGAGLSIPAGYPSMDEIWNTIIASDQVFKHTDERFYLGVHPQSESFGYDNHVELPRAVIKIVNQKNQTNYETIYSDIAKIREEGHNEYSPFVNDLKMYNAHVNTLIKKHNSSNTVSECYGEALNLIEDVVTESILNVDSTTTKTTNHLNIINELLESGINRINLFTLNHDRLLEEYLTRNKIAFSDGFYSLPNGYHPWDDRCLINATHTESSAVLLYKLHGSIDWYRLFRIEPDKEPLPRDNFLGNSIGIRMPFVAKIDNVRENYWKDMYGEPIEIEDNRPLLLIGSDTKLKQYIYEPFLFLMNQFEYSLRHFERIVVIGYSWRDRAINNIIRSWQDVNSNRSIFLINRDSNWKSHAVLPLPLNVVENNHGIENVTAEEIARFING